MGSVKSHAPVLPVLVAFSAYPEALKVALDFIEQRFGRIASVSPQFQFTQTAYYREAMGTHLLKTLIAANTLMEADELIGWKLASNDAEVALSSQERFPCQRPLNLDPGYLNLSKFVLASTKDHAHRLYLGRGIFGELTLSYRHGNWQPLPWTYPDFREPHYHPFLAGCRGIYRNLVQETIP
jgi:Domain of unknown function (DUF4416)